MLAVASSDSSRDLPGAPLAAIVPLLSCRGLTLGTARPQPTLLDTSQAVLTTSGRAALALAFRQLAIGAGDEVLVPAYHCIAITGPIRALGATPISYRLRRDLSIDVADVAARIGPRTRCVIAVHFFGFPSQLEELRRCCDEARVALVEDCAHAFYSPHADVPVGRWGDFAVGSLMKFFPVYDGGCLVSFRRDIPDPGLRFKGWLFQAKAVVDPIERWAAWSPSLFARAVGGTIRSLRTVAKKSSPRLAERLADEGPSAASGSLDFEPSWVDADISYAARFIVGRSAHARNMRRRRAAFTQLLDGLGNIRGGVPLWSELPAGVVPYVFPFILAQPETAFVALRRAGVPMYRWEDVDVQSCDTSAYYHSRLVQFPCHQDLTDAQIRCLIATIKIVSNPAGSLC